MTPQEPRIERLDDLLADRAIQGLNDEEAAELRKLVADVDGEALAFELAAAEFELALNPPPFEALPTTLRRLVEADAETYIDRVDAKPTYLGSAGRMLPWLGWVAAAALLISFAIPPQAAPGPPTPARLPGLVERLAGVAPTPFKSTDHPLAKGGGGSLVWSGDRQEGYLAVRGLAEVDSGRGVYQLWIFDASRDDRFPIDGGTFAIENSEVTTVVPIHPSLAVRKPTLFAITLEPPGGVVVSDRKRVLLTASLSINGPSP